MTPACHTHWVRVLRKFHFQIQQLEINHVLSSSECTLATPYRRARILRRLLPRAQPGCGHHHCLRQAGVRSCVCVCVCVCVWCLTYTPPSCPEIQRSQDSHLTLFVSAATVENRSPGRRHRGRERQHCRRRDNKRRRGGVPGVADTKRRARAQAPRQLL